MKTGTKRAQSRKTKTWSESRLEEITKSLTRDGLFRPETKSMIPRSLRYPIDGVMPYPRPIDEEVRFERLPLIDRIFRDDPKERAKILPAHHPGFLHDGKISYLIRRSPSSIRESIARDLTDNGTLDEFSTKFRLTALFISRGIYDQETIEDLSFDRAITYREFQSYQPKFDRMISSAKVHYFTKNPHLGSQNSKNIFTRLETVFNSLTIKQKSALQIHIMSEDPVSLEAGAKRLKISKASFKERVQSAVKKIEKAFPDLTALKPKKILIAQSEFKKEKPKKIPRRKDAPDSKTLNRWLDETTHDPVFPEWDAVFKKPRVIRKFL